MRDDAWLAGFSDGEGSFNVAPSYKDTFIPRFKISLRADDLTVLEELRAEFGGFVSMVKGNHHQNPAAQWVVGGKRDLAGLVVYFDRFPLRAKKARDYRIWRRAVRAYCAEGGAAPELPLLREALMEGRRYDADEITEEVPSARAFQLSLVERG